MHAVLGKVPQIRAPPGSHVLSAAVSKNQSQPKDPYNHTAFRHTEIGSKITSEELGRQFSRPHLRRVAVVEAVVEAEL